MHPPDYHFSCPPVKKLAKAAVGWQKPARAISEVANGISFPKAYRLGQVEPKSKDEIEDYRRAKCQQGSVDEKQANTGRSNAHFIANVSAYAKEVVFESPAQQFEKHIQKGVAGTR